MEKNTQQFQNTEDFLVLFGFRMEAEQSICENTNDYDDSGNFERIDWAADVMQRRFQLHIWCYH